MRSVSFALSLLLLLVLLPGASCGPPDVRTHAQVAKALEGPVSEVKAIVETREQKEVDAIRAQGLPPDETDRQIAALAAEYANVDRSLLALTTAYDAYVESVIAAHHEGTGLPEQLAMALLARWQSLLGAAEAVGLDLPNVPGYLKDEVQNGRQ